MQGPVYAEVYIVAYENLDGCTRVQSFNTEEEVFEFAKSFDDLDLLKVFKGKKLNLEKKVTFSLTKD